LSSPGSDWLITGISRLYSSERLSSSSAMVGISFLSPPDVPELVRKDPPIALVLISTNFAQIT
jgi:hypothetical protein